MTVRELADALIVSEATIRRDLQDLRGASGLERIHGGASLNNGSEPPVVARRRENAGAKMALARRAAEEILADLAGPLGAGETLGDGPRGPRQTCRLRIPPIRALPHSRDSRRRQTQLDPPQRTPSSLKSEEP